jgi:hypothetical protein
VCYCARGEYPAARVVVVKGAHGTYDNDGEEAGEIAVAIEEEQRAVRVEVEFWKGW